VDSGGKQKAVRRMQEYIEEHIAEPITLRMLADAAGYSPWHAERIFKEVKGQTPFEYLRAARLSRAAAQLRDTEARIVDVAFDFVFGSHEGFTRAFSKHFGMSPQAYRKSMPTGKYLPDAIHDLPPRIEKGKRIMYGHVDKPQTNWKYYPVFMQVVDRPARKVIYRPGKTAMHYGEYLDEFSEELLVEWLGWMADIREALFEPISMWLPDNLRKPGTSVWAPGVEVPTDWTGGIPEGFEVMELPPCQMMVFQGPPYANAEHEWGWAIETIMTVIQHFDPTPYGFEWADEEAPWFQLVPRAYRGYIEARPVRQLNVRSAPKRRKQRPEVRPAASGGATRREHSVPSHLGYRPTFVQAVDRPARKLILRRGKHATHYFEYTDEVGCEVFDEWVGMLADIKEALHEPIFMWLPENFRTPGTSIYAPGVEVPADYAGGVPEGFETIDLPPCKMMVFQGPPFPEGDYVAAIDAVKRAIERYDPGLYGFTWADEDAPSFQLAPRGYRGYIEARPVRQLSTGWVPRERRWRP
jgi:AraC-like DNA-binding protein